MVSEDPTMPGLTADPEPIASQQPRDALRVAVHLALIIYLSPVILLVAAISVTAIAVERITKISKAAAGRFSKVGRGAASRAWPAGERRIGSRPLLTWKRKRSRVSR